MTRHQIIFLVFVCLGIVWMIIKSLEPGGGYIPWFVGFLFMVFVNYYYGFIDKGLNPIRFYAQAGFVIFLILAFLMAHISRIEDRGLEEISKYIAVYPNVESINLIPRTSAKTIQHWQIKTNDSIEDIKKFYDDQNNLLDWEIIIKEPMLVLENRKYKLTISTAAQPHSSSNNIFYYIEEK